jgi:hypothetical protein
MRITQKQIPQFRLELPVNNALAVPRLGNVQLRFHFLRRGTSRGTYLIRAISNTTTKTKILVL